MADVESLQLQITGDAKGAKDSLDALIETLGKLKTATSGGCGLSAVADGLQKVKNGGNGAATSNAKSAKSFVNLSAKVTAAAVTLKKGGKIIASWINESNDYIENLNLFNVAMGEYADSAKQYAEEVGDLMGIDPSDWMRSQGVFMTMATGFGVANDRAATLSQQLTQLGYDLSSFYNIDVTEAMTKLRSGLAGELEPLRALGYDLSKAKLEATALSLGIDKAVDSMTQAEKAELRYYAIMTQVTTVQGDMARTLDAPANQLRVLKAQVTQAARALGDLFIPALNAVLPIAIAVMKVITALAKIIARLFGADVKENAGSAMGNLANNAGSAGDKIDEATSSAKKLKKTLLGIDELNVMPSATSGSGSDEYGGGGFDFDLPTYDFISDLTETRVAQIVKDMMKWLGITEDIDSWAELMDTRFGRILTTVGLIGGGLLAWKLTKGFITGITTLTELLKSPAYSISLGLILTITGFSMEFDGIKDAVDKGLDGFNFGEILTGGLVATGGSALLGKGVGAFIAKAFKGSAVAKAITAGGGAISTGLIGGAIGGIVAGIPMFIVGIYDAIKNGLDWLSGILIPAGATMASAGIGAIIGMLGGPIGAGIGALIGLAIGLVTDLVIIIVQNWDAIVDWCSDACATIGQFFVDLWDGIVSVWNTVAEWFNNSVITPIVNFFSSLCTSISGFFVNLWNDIVFVWNTVVNWFDTNVIRPVANFFTGLWTMISTGAINAWGGIQSVFATIGEWISGNIIQPVGNFFKGLWDGFLNGAVNAWSGVKSVFSKVGSFFKSVFSEAWAGIVEVFSVAGDIFVNIRDGIISVFKLVVNGIIKGINAVVKLPFQGINSILDRLQGISIVGVKPFNWLSWRAPVPQIPLLADGGMVSSGQMFVAREAGPELVGTIGNRSAVVNNDQIVESVSKGVYQAVSSAMGGSQGSQVVEAKVNDKVLFEVVVSRARQEAMRTGHNPLLGGV